MRKLIHNILKGASLTTALFVVQACYGSPGDFREQFRFLDIKVVSGDSGAPLQDVDIYLGDGRTWTLGGITTAEGRANVTVSPVQNMTFRFEQKGGTYAVKDTVFNDSSIYSGKEVLVKLDKVADKE